MTDSPTSGRPPIGKRADEVPTSPPADVPRRHRRLELHCVHGSMWKLLAVVGQQEFVTELGANRYPDDGELVEVNCMECRTRWQVSMTRLRERVDRRQGLEKVPLSEIAVKAPWLA